MAGSTAPDAWWGSQVRIVMDTTTPRARLDTEDPPRAVILTSALSPDEGFIRPLPDDTGDWLAARDPDGVHAARFDSLGALDDGTIDVNPRTGCAPRPPSL